MSAYVDALAKLRADNTVEPCAAEVGCAPGCCTGDDVQVTISRIVGALVLDALGPEWVDFGTFDNCREYGLTFSVPGWQFCVYEHRNSDNICVQGCPADQVQPYGPYGGGGKWDVLARAQYDCRGAAAAALIDALRFVNNNPGATREQVRRAIEERQAAR